MAEKQPNFSLQRRLWEIERGEASERNAKEAIKELNWVKYVVSTPRFSTDDLDMKDLKVGTHSLVDPLTEVYVQVKSSRNGIYDALEGLRDSVGGSLDRLNTLLVERRLIFVNGQEPLGAIQNQFTLQWEILRRHYIRQLGLGAGTLLVPSGERRRFTPLDSEDLIRSWIAAQGWEIQKDEVLETQYGYCRHETRAENSDIKLGVCKLGKGENEAQARRDAVLKIVSFIDRPIHELIKEYRFNISPDRMMLIVDYLIDSTEHEGMDIFLEYGQISRRIARAIKSIEGRGLRAKLLNILSEAYDFCPISYFSVKHELYQGSEDPLVDVWVRNVVSRTRQLLEAHKVQLVYEKETGFFWLECPLHYKNSRRVMEKSLAEDEEYFY